VISLNVISLNVMSLDVMSLDVMSLDVMSLDVMSLDVEHRDARAVRLEPKRATHRGKSGGARSADSLARGETQSASGGPDVSWMNREADPSAKQRGPRKAEMRPKQGQI
jgi:hypothetical protein